MVFCKKKNKNVESNCGHGCKAAGCGGALYGLGFVGALIYYVSNATSFWVGVLGILKAIVWPAFLVFHLLKFIGA
ncbi:MAG TPA: hypothetical protein P5277_00875 [Candidatus Paceibacterota bacterium]|nr:hypothetical protein [Candidatus Paceibacterota bacterium]